MKPDLGFEAGSLGYSRILVGRPFERYSKLLLFFEANVIDTFKI